jgi:transcriptional regulator with PAS, ATPase and Fis domain
MGISISATSEWDSAEPAMQEVMNAAHIVAATHASILILGESGTGKELLAKSIHAHSPRSDTAFVSVNCAALPETLAESLLFGHRKGFFTGAEKAHEGYVRAAAGGTLFLDEIGELSAAAQAKMLRFLESGEVIPVGESRPLSVDVRIIAATHRDLEQSVAAGTFRRDLYYRLYVVPLYLPPLRERRADIPKLTKRFLAEFASQHGQSPTSLDSAAMCALCNYQWPGNIRELRNLCERLTILTPGRILGVNSLPVEIRSPLPRVSDSVVLTSAGIVLDDIEKDLIQQALELAGGNRSRAARLLGLTRDTLLYRLKKFCLE